MDAKDYNGPGLKSGRKGQKSPLSKLGRKHVGIVWENNMSINALFLLPASLMTRWNSLFVHTLTHGQGWVGGVGMMTFLSLAHM